MAIYKQYVLRKNKIQNKNFMQIIYNDQLKACFSNKEYLIAIQTKYFLIEKFVFKGF